MHEYVVTSTIMITVSQYEDEDYSEFGEIDSVTVIIKYG